MKNSRKALHATFIIIAVSVLIICGGLYFGLTPAARQPAPYMVSPAPVSQGSAPAVATSVPINPVSGNNAWNGMTVISSPKAGDTYAFGQTVSIKWNPELIDAQTIQLIPMSGNANATQIFYRSNLADPVSAKGELDYTIQSDLYLYPGQYRVEIIGPDDKAAYASDIFMIVSPVTLLPRESKPYYIQGISGIDNAYAPGDHMQFDVSAIDGDGTPADSSKGFIVSVNVINADGNGGYSGTGYYDSAKQAWHFDVPLQEGDYFLATTLYCSQSGLNSVCAQEYGFSTNVSRYTDFAVTP